MNTILKSWTSSFLLLAVLSTAAHAQNSSFIRDEHVEAGLVGEMSHLVAGKPYRVGLLLRHDANWHTYWISSATGYATSIEWDLTPGFEVSDLSWPTPEVYATQGFTEYVYHGETLLVATLTPPTDLDGSTVEIGFTADWLMCKDSCIPGGMNAILRLPVAADPATPSEKWARYFQEADAQMPVDSGSYSITAWKENSSIMLQVSGNYLPDSAYFYNAQGTTKPEEEATAVTEIDGALTLRLPLSDSIDEEPTQLSGVLKTKNGWAEADGRTALAIDLPLTAKPELTITEAKEPVSWASILFLAFVGGMILNLMPCVFPVLGIKIMGFVNQAGESRAKVVAHGFVFSAGVLISFWVLAGILLLLRSSGNQLGWGFQLQSPGFVLVLAMLLFAFGLNMSGLFEVGQSAVGVGSKLTGKSGLGGTFFSGVLATVVATPCAAPFLAPALGAALALPALASFTVFTFIALGLSAPYLLLSSFPSLINSLPRPGAWMETFKQAMGFLLYATVAFLIWVLAGQLTEAGGYSAFGLLKALLSLIILAVGLWIYGRWAAFHKPPRTRLIAVITSVLLLLAALGTGYSGTTKSIEGESAIRWEKWEPGKAEDLASQGRIVYVDFTARWCVTCQTNKATVFSSGKVIQKLTDLEVVLLKADWTHQDPEISQALSKFNRSAVPFNLVYGPAKAEPLILPEILTPGTVLDSLDEVSGR